jgi:cytochrome c oxidase subunit 2
MFAVVPLFPDQASTLAPRVDALFFFVLAITASVAALVTVLILYFAVRYRRRSASQSTPRILGSVPLELFWTLTPLAIFLVMFAWGASVFTAVTRPPEDSLDVYVVGKQWMWKIQHPDGQREINELHVPLGRPVRLTLTSEDVIHDFFVPAFRTKIDVLPDRYVQTWFEPTRVGRYHLFCSQYCGTNHAGMIGWVEVMEPSAYAAWLTGAPGGGALAPDGSLAVQGRKLFLKLQCVTCHGQGPTSDRRAPVLEDLYRRPVSLRDGRTVIADEAYLRESILYPQAKIVQGWEPIMPTFKGQVNEEELIQLIAYIKSLRPGHTPFRTEDFPPPQGAPTVPPPEDRQP